MPLFYETVLEHERQHCATVGDRLVQLLSHSTVVHVSNVARYVFDDRRSQWTTDDFPNLAPPWEIAWFEYRIPSTIWHTDHHALNPGSGYRIGVLTWCQDVPPSTVLLVTPRPQWLVHYTLFSEKVLTGYQASCDAHRYTVGMRWTALLAPDGTLCRTVEKDEPAFLRDDIGNTGMGSKAGIFVIPMLFATSLCHCKNVTVVSHDPPLWKRKSATARPWRSRYHTLEIEPMMRILRTARGSGTMKQALHLCRGHFKDYRQHGLFGHHKGLYWWDQHVRGSFTTGIVEKDYAVVPPGDHP